MRAVIFLMPLENARLPESQLEALFFPEYAFWGKGQAGRLSSLHSHSGNGCPWSLKVCPTPCIFFFLQGDFLLKIVQAGLNSGFLQEFVTRIPFCIVDCQKFLGKRRPWCSWDSSGKVVSRGSMSQRSLSSGATLTLTLRQLSSSVQRWGWGCSSDACLSCVSFRALSQPHNENQTKAMQVPHTEPPAVVTWGGLGTGEMRKPTFAFFVFQDTVGFSV